MTRSRKINFGFDRFSGLYLWALFVLVFGTWRTSLFLTTDTLHSIAAEQAIVAMLGIAVLVPLAAGVFDLSIGATINMSAVTVALLQTKQHFNMWEAIFAAIGIGVVIGAFNGFLVVVLKISSFIATLATTTIVGAFQVIVTNQSQPLPPTSTAWLNLTQRQVFGFQIVVLYLIVLAVLFWWILEHTPAGRYIYAVGGNAEAARLSGVRVGKWVWLAFISSGTVCGLAGVFYSSLSGPSLTFGAAPAPARVRGRVPRLDADQTRTIQRVGRRHRGVRARHRRPRAIARHQRAVAQRHVQRRRTDRGRRVRGLASGQGRHAPTNRRRFRRLGDRGRGRLSGSRHGPQGRHHNRGSHYPRR